MDADVVATVSNDTPTARSGHWALRAYLYFYGAMSFAALVYIPFGAAQFHARHPDAPSWSWTVRGILQFVNFASIIGLWNYQRWAHHALIVVLTANGILGAWLDSSFDPLGRAWVAYCVLWLLLKLGGPERSAMSKLR